MLFTFFFLKPIHLIYYILLDAIYFIKCTVVVVVVVVITVEVSIYLVVVPRHVFVSLGRRSVQFIEIG